MSAAPAAPVSACHAVRYARRRPEKGTLYRIVQAHAETVFAEAEARSEGGGPLSRLDFPFPSAFRDIAHSFYE